MGNSVRIDFSNTIVDFAEMENEAQKHSEEILTSILPDGQIRGSEYLSRNPTRADNSIGSFSINMDTGVWSDFATDDKGAGFISLVQYVFDMDSRLHAATRLKHIIRKINSSTNTKKPRIQKSKKDPIIPVPENAPRCNFIHPELGKPTKKYAYRDPSGILLMYEARWDYTDENGNKQKQIYPLTYCKLEDGKCDWRAKAPPKPWPLYQLDRIHDENHAMIIVCEGTKAAHAAQKLLPDYNASNDFLSGLVIHRFPNILDGENDESGRIYH